MYGMVKIGDKEVGFLANAATSFRFKNLFRSDLLSIISQGDNASVEDYERLAYVMAKQAEKADMNSLTDEDFYTWLEAFDFTDLMNAIPEIVGIYMQNKQTTSDPK